MTHILNKNKHKRAKKQRMFCFQTVRTRELRLPLTAVTLYLVFVGSMYVGGPYNQITYYNSVNNEWSDKTEGHKVKLEWLLDACSVTQSCLIICNLMDCSPPGSSVHGIFQARMLEWVAILFSRGSSRPRDLLERGVEPASLVSPAFIQLYQTGSPIYILQSYPIKHKNLVRGWFFFLLRQIFSFSSAQFSTHPKDGLVENILP